MADQPLDVPALFSRAIDEFDKRVRLVGDDQWTNATPCTEWSVKDLVNHMVTENLWVPGLLDGKTIDELGGMDAFEGDNLGSDPKHAWTEASQKATQAAQRDGAMDTTAHLSYGDFPASFYILQLLADHIIHAWDLAKGIEDDDELDQEMVQFVYQGMLPYADSLSEGDSFADPIPVPDDADPQTKLLGLVGRRR